MRLWRRSYDLEAGGGLVVVVIITLTKVTNALMSIPEKMVYILFFSKYDSREFP